MAAPDPRCGIVAGSMAKLYIARDPEATSLDWVEVRDLDNFTIAQDSTDTNVNEQGWIKTLPMERGMTVTATGRMNVNDEGQQLINAISLEIGCNALAYFRLYVPGPRTEDPARYNVGFWSWANLQDTAAASTDPFSFGVELRLFAQPDELDTSNQPAAAVAALPLSGQTAQAQGASAAPQTAPSQQSASSRARQSASTESHEAA